MILILPSGHEVLIDDDDYERLRGFRYYLHKKGYAYRFVNHVDGYNKKTVVYLHHDIVGNHHNKVVDHINRNKLDNRKENLRVVSNADNLRNSGKQKGEFSSKYKGVSWNPVSRGWRACVKESKRIDLGLFTTEEAAANAYNDYVRKNQDEFSHINDVPFDDNWEFKRIPNRRDGVGKSNFIGVSWSKAMNKWQSHIMINYKSIYLGCFETEVEAAKAYNEASLAHRGNKARLNNV